MVMKCIKSTYHSIYHVYHVVCYKMIIVWNIITSRHALNNEANVIVLFGDSVLGQEENSNIHVV